MCKNPASECKPLEEDNVQAEEDNVTSEEESESTETDESYFTESSVDNRPDSDSDAESASGNRVTPEMVLLLMLKEQGAITEEQYAEKAEKCEDNIKSLIPKIPRLYSVDTIDYTNIDGYFNNENSDNEMKVYAELIENLLQELIGDEKENVETSNGSEVTSHKNINLVEKDESKDVESVEKVTGIKENSACDLLKDDTSQDRISKEQCIGESIVKQQEATIQINENESNKEINDLPHKQVIYYHVIYYQEDQQQTVTSENIPSENSVDKKATEQSEKGDGECTVSECTRAENIVKEVENTEIMLMEIDENPRQFIDDKSITDINAEKILNKNSEVLVESTNIATNNNAGQDTALIKTDNESRKDLNTKNEFNQTTGKITKSFRYIVDKLLREKRIQEEDEEDRISDENGQTYAEVLRSYVRGLDERYGPNMTASKVNVSDGDDDEDDGNLKEFALFLNFYSPSSYKYILETFNTPLPAHRELCSWYLKDDDEPGLTERAFKILKQKSSQKRLTCTLMFIDIFLKNHGRCYDQVNYGGGSRDGDTDRAVLAYVFMLVSLDEDWKMPIGYIYARHVPAETQAELVRICLTQCHDAGADVVAVTFETLTPAEYLGCSFKDPKNLKTTFKHPVCDRDVAVWIDPCLALKSARQTLKVKGSLRDDEGNRVRWNLIRKLRNLDMDEVIDYDKPEFFELRNHIVKVSLTTEIFSKSLARALELSEDFLPYMFMDTEPTRTYVVYINMVYSILHSRVTRRMRHIVPHLKAVKKYLIRVFCNEENGLSPFDRVNLAWGNKRKGYRYFLKGEAPCGFLSFLICIESFMHLYTTLIKKEKRFSSLDPQRLCKVQAENFVTTLRVHSCFDPEYYSGSDFQGYYNTLFDALEKKPLFTDKSVSLEHWPLKNTYPPVVTIKLTSGKRSYDDIYSSEYKLKKLKKTSDENRATKVVRQYSKSLDTERDLSTRKNMVSYIAGWIAAKFAKCLRCEKCIDMLCTDKKLWFHKFIPLKQIYAVCLPSEELFRICWECERALRMKKTPARLRAWVLRRLAPKFPWSSRVGKHPPGHHIQLARAVIDKYVPLRIPAPFSSKERTRIINMFRRFTSKDYGDSYDELAEWMDSSSEYDEPFDQLY